MMQSVSYIKFYLSQICITLFKLFLNVQLNARLNLSSNGFELFEIIIIKKNND